MLFRSDLYFADIQAGKLFSDQCRQGKLVPFIRGGLLPEVVNCQATERARQNTNQKSRRLENVFQDGLQQFLRIFK